MNKCLIGYNGFVGSNLLNNNYNYLYNSENIEEIKYKEFDLLICSAIRADMFMANTEPERDLENIKNLFSILQKVKSKKAVLISTIAVYPQPVRADERSSIFEKVSSYGVNRRFAEIYFKEIFNQSLIIRLPALFGNNLKKNFIFDIINRLPSFLTKEKFNYINTILNDKYVLYKYYNYDKIKNIYVFSKDNACNDNMIDRLKELFSSINETSLNFTNSDSKFQFYSLYRLNSDIEIALNNNLEELNICSEPIIAKEIMNNIFNECFDSHNSILYDYDMRSMHSKLWGNHFNYLYSKAEILYDLKKFFVANGVLK